MYPEFFTEEDGFPFIYEEKWENLSEALAKKVRGLIDAGKWEDAGKLIEAYYKNKMKNSELELYGVICEMEPTSYSGVKDSVVDGNISAETLILLILHGSYDKAMVLRKVIPWCEAAGDNNGAQKMQTFYERVKENPLSFAYSKRVHVKQ